MKIFAAVFTLFLASPALAQNPSVAKMGITHSTDPEAVSVLSAAGLWSKMGSIDKSTNVFTPVASATVGDVNILNWAGQPVSAPTAPGVGATSGLLPNVNAFIVSAAPTSLATWRSAHSFSSGAVSNPTPATISFPPGAVTGNVIKIYNKGPNGINWTYGASPVATTAMAFLVPGNWDYFTVNDGDTAVSALTGSSALTATVVLELGSGLPGGAGSYPNSSVNANGAVSIYNTLVGGLSNVGGIANPMQTTPPGTPAANFLVGVQGNTNGVPIPTAPQSNVTPINCSAGSPATTTAANASNLGTASIHGFTIVNLNTTNNIGINPFGAAVIGTGPTITLNAATPSYTTPEGFGLNTNLSVVASAPTPYACWAW